MSHVELNRFLGQSSPSAKRLARWLERRPDVVDSIEQVAKKAKAGGDWERMPADENIFPHVFVSPKSGGSGSTPCVPQAKGAIFDMRPQLICDQMKVVPR